MLRRETSKNMISSKIKQRRFEAGGPTSLPSGWGSNIILTNDPFSNLQDM